MNVLVLDAGSSTLKFELIRTSVELIEEDADERRALLVEGVEPPY